MSCKDWGSVQGSALGIAPFKLEEKPCTAFDSGKQAYAH